MKIACQVAVTGLCALLTFSAWAQQDLTQITSGSKHDVDPVVSPDGKYLAFASDRTGNYDIYLLKFGESGVVQLTQSDRDDRYPSWTANSKTVIFSSRRTGNGDLYQTDADGQGGFLQLTDGDDIEEDVSVNPRGSNIVFSRAPKKLIQIRPKWSVVTAESLGSARTARVLGEGYQAQFAPDGKHVVFTSRRTKNDDVWVMNPDGGMQTQLTSADKDDQEPCYSPDGKMIVFSSKRAGNFDIWVMEADGSNQRQLTTGPADDREPCWSVGGYIYYVHEKSESNSNIVRIKAP